MSFIERFKDATIGFSGYRRLVRDGASGFGYMALLLFIVMAISCVISTVHFQDVVTTGRNQVASMPDFRLAGGKFEFDGPMPYEFKDANGIVLMTVDTTGKTTPEQINARGGGFLVTRDYYYQGGPTGGTTYNFSDPRFNQLSLTKADLQRYLGFNWLAVVPIAYVMLYLFQLGAKALDALILAVIATIVASSMRRKLAFNDGFKVGLYAMSLSVILQWVWQGFTTLSLVGFFVWWGLAILYTIMGVRAYASDDAILE